MVSHSDPVWCRMMSLSSLWLELVPTLIASQIKVMNKAKENSAQLPTIIILLYGKSLIVVVVVVIAVI